AEEELAARAHALEHAARQGFDVAGHLLGHPRREPGALLELRPDALDAHAGDGVTSGFAVVDAAVLDAGGLDAHAISRVRKSRRRAQKPRSSRIADTGSGCSSLRTRAGAG